MKPTLTFLLFWSFLQGDSTPSGSDALPPRDPAVQRSALVHWVRTFASEDLGNRGAGAASTRRVAELVARAFERSGLRPAGDGGGYLQECALQEVRYPEPPRLVFTTKGGEEIAGECGVDFTLQVRGVARSTGDLPIRVVSAIRQSVPDPDPDAAIYVEGTRKRKEEVLRRSNLVDLSGFGLELEAIIDVQHAKPGPRTSTPRAWRGRKSEAKADGGERVVLRGKLLEAFVTRPEIESVRLEVPSEVEEIPLWNVVGELPGEGEAPEALVVSCRYDQAGVGTGRGGGRVVRGVDEASGLAAFLEIAEALGAGPRPRRTVVFLATASDGKVPQGLRTYLERPCVPLDRTLAWLRLDRFARPDPLLEEPDLLWMSGAERSTLLEVLRAHGVHVAPDPRPRAKLYVALGDVRVAQTRVVTHTVSSFPMDQARGSVISPEAVNAAHLEAATRELLRAVRVLATDEVEVAWKPGREPREIPFLK